MVFNFLVSSILTTVSGVFGTKRKRSMPEFQGFFDGSIDGSVFGKSESECFWVSLSAGCVFNGAVVMLLVATLPPTDLLSSSEKLLISRFCLCNRTNHFQLVFD